MKFENNLLYGKLGKIDKNKKTILAIDYYADGKLMISDFPFKLVRDELKKDYNVITIYTKERIKFENLKENEFVLTPKKINPLYKRKKETEKYLDYNIKLLKKEIFELFDKIPKIDLVFLVGVSYLGLPVKSFVSKEKSKFLYDLKQNYYDYIGNDEEIIEIIKKTNKKYFSDIKTLIRYLPPYAIVSELTGSIFSILKLLYDNKKFDKLLTYILDPETGIRAFVDGNNIKHRFFYYADDFRGTRDLEKSNAAAIQQLYKIKFSGEYEKYPKTKNVLFMGTLLYNKSRRSDIWNEFLKDFKDENSDYFIPLKMNGLPAVNKDDTYYENRILKRTEKDIIDLYLSIKNHPLRRGYIEPKDATTIVKDYKFGLVFRCVSNFDSLTNKVFEYVYNDTLPLIDYKYDIDYLQVPKELKEKVEIKNTNDIYKMIEKYSDENLRQKVLNEFKELFDNNFNLEDRLKEDINRIKDFIES